MNTLKVVRDLIDLQPRYETDLLIKELETLLKNETSNSKRITLRLAIDDLKAANRYLKSCVNNLDYLEGLTC